MPPSYTITPIGDAGLLVDFGNRIDEALNRRVLALCHPVRATVPGVVDLVPSYASLAIFYDAAALRTKNRTAFSVVKALVEPLLTQSLVEETSVVRQVRIPVCYAPAFAPDLAELAEQKNISTEELIALHTQKTYRVYTLGFLPGFAYMGTVHHRLATPRKATPRIRVPAGAVGIAGAQTGIYPLPSPGGWNLIGRTPLTLFAPSSPTPVLLQPGDEVQFYSITEDAFADYQSRPA